MKRVFVALTVVSLYGCVSSPTAPTTPTRVITLAGDLAFGDVNFGSTPERTFTISNSGNAIYTFTGMTAAGGTGSTGFGVTPVNGTISPGSSQTVIVRFSPTIAQDYSTVLTVAGNHTGGTNTINVSGTGVNNLPVFSRSGSGADVFDLPVTVARVRIFADYSTGNCETFIVRIAGRNLLSETLGSCPNASGRHFEGTYATPGGGVFEVRNATGVSWTFVEQR